jgi:hypothetical protein
VVLAAFLEMGKDEDRERRNKKADGVRALPTISSPMSHVYVDYVR